MPGCSFLTVSGEDATTSRTTPSRSCAQSHWMRRCPSKTHSLLGAISLRVLEVTAATVIVLEGAEVMNDANTYGVVTGSS